MALNVGTRLGHYDVTALIGEGGMGQVYRARDTKLDRDVALKILPDAFVNDPERLAGSSGTRRCWRRSTIRTPRRSTAWRRAATLPRSSSKTVEGPTLQDRIPG